MLMISGGTILAFLAMLGFFLYWVLAFLVLYHLIRFGVSGQPKKIAAVFMGGSLVLSLITVLLFAQVDVSSFGSLTDLSLFKFD